MKTWWLKPISITLLFSLGISGIFSALIGTYTNQKWHNFKLETLKRTAVSLALNGNYIENFKSFGPIPEDGSSVYGRFWIVNQFGKVVLSSSSHVVSEDVVKIGIGVSREVKFPIEKKVGSFFSETRFYFLPVPGYSSDTYIVQDLNRGPGKQWFRRVILMLLAHSVVICLGFAVIILWIFRRRSKEIQLLMADLFSGKSGARMQLDRIDRTLHLFDDINQIAGGVEALYREIRRVIAARSDLLQQLAHDIRTPLTALESATEALHASGGKLSPSDAWKLTEIAHSESRYLRRLVEELLFVAEQTEASGRVEQVDLVQETLEFVNQRKILHGEKYNYSIVKNSSGFPVMIQSGAWSRVLANLFDNAEKHGKAPIEVCVEDNGLALVIKVRDHGIGIPETDIFSYGVHQRRDNSDTNAERKLTNLGAIIVRNLVSSAGGTLKVRNHPEGGLEVEIEFKRSI